MNETSKKKYVIIIINEKKSYMTVRDMYKEKRKAYDNFPSTHYFL